MNFESPVRGRKSIRLQEYDYSNAGAYFVTICTHQRKCLFGDVVNEQMIISKIGKIAESCWKRIPQHHQHVNLDYFVVMPNHVHGILFLTDDDDRRGVRLNAPTRDNQIVVVE